MSSVIEMTNGERASESTLMAVFSCGTNLGCGVDFYGYLGTPAKSECDTKERL